MSFQILGCQESNALNGARFGVETKKLCPFEDKREKPKQEFYSRDTIWKGVSQLRNHPLAHECHFAAPVRPFRSYEMGYENSPSPQNPPPAAKMLQASKWAAKMFLFFSMGCENVFLFSLPLQDDLQATKWFVKPRKIVKMPTKPRNHASKEESPLTEITHKASYSISYLLKTIRAHSSN